MRARSVVLSLSLCACVSPGERIEVGSSTATITNGDGEVTTETFTQQGDDGYVISNGLELRELSRIGSPIVDGTTVQATDVLIDGDFIFATYNTRGDVFAGALQVFDITDVENPVLHDEARFIGSEANRVRKQGDYVYIAGGDSLLGAVLDTFLVENGTLTHLNTLSLPGFQTTMLQVNGEVAYATSGDIGGLSVLSLGNPAQPEVVDFVTLSDARFVVELNQDEVVVLTGGDTATLSRYTLGSWDAPSASVPVEDVTVGAPSWGNLVGNDLYISADVGGVAAFSTEDGEITPEGIIPTTGDANGLAPTPDQRIAILANGQEGLVAMDVQSAAGAHRLAQYDVPEDCGSANAIAVRHDLIAMADGLGGVKLLSYNINQVGSRLATILLTFSNPEFPQEIAAQLASQAVNWTSPASPSRVLVVRDDRHSGEFEADSLFVVDLLTDQGYDVEYMQEPEAGISDADVDGFDVIWFSNPGWPLDDRLTFDTLVSFSEAGGGVVLQGDDMTWTSSSEFTMSPLTYLENIDNGTRFCGTNIDNNNGGRYRVTFEDSDHPVIDGLVGQSFTYGDDIDRSVPLGLGEEVLAWATLDGDTECEDRSPVVVTFGPERAAQLQGL